MAKFRRKPVVIEAVPVRDIVLAGGADRSLPPWARAAFDEGTLVLFAGALEVRTLAGWVKGARGDWLIRGVKGELYPCTPDIFDATYEPVTGD